MSPQPSVYRGVIHGRTIELDCNTELPEGQQVRVTVQPCPETSPTPGEGLKNSAGGWSDDPEGVDEFIKWTYEQRQLSRPEIDP